MAAVTPGYAPFMGRILLRRVDTLNSPAFLGGDEGIPHDPHDHVPGRRRGRPRPCLPRLRADALPISLPAAGLPAAGLPTARLSAGPILSAAGSDRGQPDH